MQQLKVQGLSTEGLKPFYTSCKIDFSVWCTRLVQFYSKKWQGYVGTHPTFCYQDYFTGCYI